MGTRAWIGYQNEDDTITATYSHWNGDPNGVGVMLDQYYNTPDKAKEVANLGYISNLHEDISQTKKEAANQIEPMIFHNRYSFIRDMNDDIHIEWGYCYTRKNYWMVYEGKCDKGLLLSKVVSKLKRE